MIRRRSITEVAVADLYITEAFIIILAFIGAIYLGWSFFGMLAAAGVFS
jgi:hypothetical protein